MSKSKIFILALLFASAFNHHSSPHAQQLSAATNRTEAKRLAALAVLPQAKAAAFRIRDHFHRDALLQLIGVAEAKAGDLDAAIQTANNTSLPPIDTLDAIGEQLAQTNDLAKARVLGRKLKEGGFPALLSRLIDAQAARGDITGALKRSTFLG